MAKSIFMKLKKIKYFPYHIFKKSDGEKSFFILTLITGVLSAVVAWMFEKSINVFSYLTYNQGEQGNSFTIDGFLVGSFFVLLSALLSLKYFIGTTGSGVPQIKLAFIMNRGRTTVKQFIGKFIVSTLSLSSGMSFGREGPTLFLTSAIGSFLGQMFTLSSSKTKALMAVGASGGLAAAFNTPIAAVIFTLEEIIGDLNTKLLGSIIIASVMASITAWHLHGNHPTFFMTNFQFNDERELFYYLLIAILCAVMGSFWVKSVLYLKTAYQRFFPRAKILVMYLSFVITVLISISIPQVIGGGHHVVQEIFSNEIHTTTLFALIFLAKFFCSALCYSSGASGGLFVPTLCMGAILGGLVGSIGHDLSPDFISPISSYAVVGMGAFFAAIIRTPFTSIVMTFEMTHDYKVIVPLMVSNIVSYLIAERVYPGSVYEKISAHQGIHLPSKKENEFFENNTVEDIMRTEKIFFDASETVLQAKEELKEMPSSTFCILKNNRLFGLLTRGDIVRSQNKNEEDEELHVEDICSKDFITIFPDQNLMMALQKLKRFHVFQLIVVDRLDPLNVLGIITSESIIRHFGIHTQKEHDSEEIIT